MQEEQILRLSMGALAAILVCLLIILSKRQQIEPETCSHQLKTIGCMFRYHNLLYVVTLYKTQHNIY